MNVPSIDRNYELDGQDFEVAEIWLSNFDREYKPRAREVLRNYQRTWLRRDDSARYINRAILTIQMLETDPWWENEIKAA